MRPGNACPRHPGVKVRPEEARPEEAPPEEEATYVFCPSLTQLSLRQTGFVTLRGAITITYLRHVSRVWQQDWTLRSRQGKGMSISYQTGGKTKSNRISWFLPRRHKVNPLEPCTQAGNVGTWSTRITNCDCRTSHGRAGLLPALRDSDTD